MKKILVHATTLVFILFSLTACFDITEEFTIHEDSSGLFVSKTDMSKMLQLVEQLEQQRTDKENTKEKQAKNKLLDTTVYLKDNAKLNEFSKDQLALVKTSFLHQYFNYPQRQLYIHSSFPFKSITTLDDLYKLAPKAVQYMSEQSQKENPMGNDKMKIDMAGSNQFFEILAGSNFIERKVKVKELLEQATKDKQLAQVKPFLSSGTLTCIVHTPRPIKKCEHQQAEVSADKKTVTFRFSLADYYNHPELLAFRIDY